MQLSITSRMISFLEHLIGPDSGTPQFSQILYTHRRRIDIDATDIIKATPGRSYPFGSINRRHTIGNIVGIALGMLTIYGNQTFMSLVDHSLRLPSHLFHSQYMPFFSTVITSKPTIDTTIYAEVGTI